MHRITWTALIPALALAGCSSREDTSSPAEPEQATIEEEAPEQAAIEEEAPEQATVEEEAPEAAPLDFKDDEAAAFAAAREREKGVMIDVFAEWCVPCLLVDEIYAEPEIAELIRERFVPLRVDVTEPTDETRAKQDRYDAHNLPTLIFMSEGGEELRRAEWERPSADKLRAVLEEL